MEFVVYDIFILKFTLHNLEGLTKNHSSKKNELKASTQFYTYNIVRKEELIPSVYDKKRFAL